MLLADRLSVTLKEAGESDGITGGVSQDDAKLVALSKTEADVITLSERVRGLMKGSLWRGVVR